MKRKFECRSLAVQDLFAAPFLFMVPVFQRPFSWTEENAERLLNDLRQASAEAADDIYFIGAILLMGGAPSNQASAPATIDGVFDGAERPFDIVDGLQRITTLSVLLAVMRDLLGGLMAQRPSASAVHGRLTAALFQSGKRKLRIDLGGTDAAFLDHVLSEAGACFVPPVASVMTQAQERIVEIRDFLVEQLKTLDAGELERLAGFILENCSLVAIGTDTIDRAFQMFTVLNDSGKPLSRNDILKAELIGAVPLAERAAALAGWDELSLRLGEKFEDLFSFISTEYGRGSQSILEAIRAQVAQTPGGAGAFVSQTLLPAGAIADAIFRADHQGAGQSDAINDMLRHLSWLNGQEWVPPLMAFWRRHGHDAEALRLFLAALDRFVYGIRIVALGNDKRLQRMAALTDAIAAGAPARGPWPQLQFTRDELRNITFGLRDLHRRSPQICRLVLQRLEERMGGQVIDSKNSRWTVEHILPLKVPAQSAWKTDIADGDARAKLATCLGNLTLVTKTVNEAAANHDYARKHACYFGPKAAPISVMTEELRTVPVWNAALIEDRLGRMMRAVDALWHFDTP